MKTKLLSIICALAVVFGGVQPALAGPHDPGDVVVDAFLVRPVCFLATVIGSAAFVVAFPIAVISKSVHSSANALVIVPAEATFTRQLGDLESLTD
jgi:hypothetical protein